MRGFDTAAALTLMRRSAEDPARTQRWALESWLDAHYVGNAAISLEYAMADFALARYARALGETAVFDAAMDRSGWWTEIWNADDGYLEPRVPPALPAFDAARIYEFEVFGPASPSTNLAPGGTATASGSCSAEEGPEKAINGTGPGAAATSGDNHAGALVAGRSQFATSHRPLRDPPQAGAGPPHGTPAASRST